MRIRRERSSTPTLLFHALLLGAALTLGGCDRTGSTPSAAAAPEAPAAQPASNAGQPVDPKRIASNQSTSAAPTADAGTADTGPFESPEEPLPPGQISGKGPQLTFGKSMHDFGRIADVREHRTSFPFRNTGTQTLTIEDVKADCGCTGLTLDKRVFEPGEGDWIRVGFKPQGHGKQTKYITVISNAANGPTMRVAIAADIEPLISVEPSMYLNLGTVSMNQDNQGYIDIVGRYPEVVIDSVNVPNPQVSGRVVEMDGSTDIMLPTPARQRHRVAITLHKGTRWGAFYSVVSIKSRITHPVTGEQIQHSQSIHVNANVFGRIQASEAMFSVGATAPGAPIEKTITITSADGKPWTMTGAYLQNVQMPGLNLRVDPITQPNIAGYRVTISGNPGSYQGALGGRVLVLTDVPGEEQFMIPIYGIVRPLQ